jgi:RimJ/RimL family protein N-acetyltransferase
MFKRRSSKKVRYLIIYTLFYTLYLKVYNYATLHSADKLIGTIGFWHMQPKHHRAEIAYMLIPAYQGKGPITEVTRYALNEIKLHSIAANVNPANQHP